jgi:hypothetical protein
LINNKKSLTYYAPVTICLISHFPHFPMFKTCLSQLYYVARAACDNAISVTVPVLQTVRVSFSSSSSSSSSKTLRRKRRTPSSATHAHAHARSSTPATLNNGSGGSVGGRKESKEEKEDGGGNASAASASALASPAAAAAPVESVYDDTTSMASLSPSPSVASLTSLPGDDSVAPLVSINNNNDNNNSGSGGSGGGDRSDRKKKGARAGETRQEWKMTSQHAYDATGVLERSIVHLVDEVPLPIPGKVDVRFSVNNVPVACTLSATRPAHLSSYRLSYLFDALGVDNVITLLTAVLMEQRIVFHSVSFSVIARITLSLQQLLYPFQWYYAHIPCLTDTMLDAHEMPQPYLLGIHSSLLDDLVELDDVIVVDVDHARVQLGVDTKLPLLPQQEGRNLWRRLRRCVEQRAEMQDRLVSAPLSPASSPAAASASLEQRDKAERAFDFLAYEAMLRFFAAVLPDYRAFLFFASNQPVFNRAGFLARCTVDDADAVPFYT